MGFLADTLASAPPATWAQMMQYYQPTPTYDPNSILATGTPPSAPTVDIPGIGKVQFHTSGQGQTYATRLNPDGTSTAFGPGTADPNGPIAQGTMANDGTFKQLFDALKYPAAGALAGYALSSMVGAGAAGATGASSAGYAEGWSGAAGVADPTMAAGGAAPVVESSFNAGGAPETLSAAQAAGGLSSTVSTAASGLGTAASLGNIVQGLGTAVVGSNVSKSAQTNAAMADPFAGQNAQYQPLLAGSVAKSVNSPVTDYASIYGKQLNDLMTNPTAVLPTTPGYEAAIQAIERSGAAQGYTGSGNMVTALATGIGGQFYQQQLADLQSIINMGTAANSQNTTQITQLAGGNWNPGTGANIAQTGAVDKAGATLGGLNGIVQGVTGLVNNYGTTTAPVSSTQTTSAWS